MTCGRDMRAHYNNDGMDPDWKPADPKPHEELKSLVREFTPKTETAFVYGVPVVNMTREELIACLCLAVSKIPGIDIIDTTDLR